MSSVRERTLEMLSPQGKAGERGLKGQKVRGNSVGTGGHHLLSDAVSTSYS